MRGERRGKQRDADAVVRTVHRRCWARAIPCSGRAVGVDGTEQAGIWRLWPVELERRSGLPGGGQA